ncbi:hypothetical protein AGMMS50239_40170 [Bacteroidia bacterium]|nr:hypothetical protein AGMMS50239_40170 [Bacteroidia bacterium]
MSLENNDMEFLIKFDESFNNFLVKKFGDVKKIIKHTHTHT